MPYEDQILELVKKGPVQPMQIAKALNTNSILASAMLSELSSKGLLKISYLKIGSSPLYYDPSDPTQLQKFVYALNEKEKKAYDIISEKKAVPNTLLNPLMQTCMKELKDFAQPIEVIFEGKSILFWKWYLLPDAEVEQYTRNYFNIEENKKSRTGTKPIELNEKEVQNTSNKIQQDEQIQQKSTQVQSKEAIKAKHKKKKITKDPLFMSIESYFSKRYIRITEHIASKKNKEHEFIIQKFDGLKENSYYCKAVKKRGITYIDISLAYVSGKMKKLPILFLYKGNLTKSAQKIIENLPDIFGEKI